MNLFPRNFFKVCATTLIALVAIFTLPVNAAVFLPSNGSDTSNIEVNKIEENLYISSQNVKINAPIKKDLVVSGNTVEINAPIERNIIALGGTIKINSTSVGATVRAAGGSIEISGNFEEDVVVAAGNVTLKNAKIRGDLIVSSGNLVIKDSKIGGKFIGSYGQIDGNIKDQVTSQNISIIAYDSSSNGKNDSFKWFWRLGAEISVILGLILITYFLSKRKRLSILEIMPNNKFGIDILAGIGYFILPILIFLPALLLQIYPLVTTLWLMIILGMFLSNIFLPIYMANFAKNTFNLQIKLSYLVFAVYAVMVVLSLIPGASVLAGLIMFIFFLANFGFLTRKLFGVINNSLKSNK